MTSVRRLRYTAEARRDLRAILRYSLRTWGERQRDVYAQRLADAADDLTGFPNLGSSRDDLAPGLRGHPVGEHVIFYRVDDQAVVIIRILHAKLDVAAQFGGSSP